MPQVNQDRLGIGSRRVVVVTVTTTRSSLGDLLTAAGQTLVGSFRFLRFINKGANVIYIGQDATVPASITDAPGIPPMSGTTEFNASYEASYTILDDMVFATNSGSSVMTVEALY